MFFFLIGTLSHDNSRTTIDYDNEVVERSSPHHQMNRSQVKTNGHFTSYMKVNFNLYDFSTCTKKIFKMLNWIVLMIRINKEAIKKMLIWDLLFISYKQTTKQKNSLHHQRQVLLFLIYFKEYKKKIYKTILSLTIIQFF